MTIFDIISDKQYQHKGILTKLICYFMDIKKDDIVKHYDDTIDQSKIDQIISSYKRYDTNKEPIEYILGYVEFLNYKFDIDDRALIPRAETEYMIQAVSEYLHALDSRDIEVRDIGCGCGVLGLSVVLHNISKIYKLILTDSEQTCLDLTRQNILKYKNKRRDIEIITIQSDLLSFVKEHRDIDKKIVIVSNLPYIPDDTFDQNADESAKKREPRVAFLGGKDGLDLYRKMLDQVIVSELYPVMFLEMMTWQVDRLIQEYGDRFEFEVKKTFHFNIVIVKVSKR